MYPVLLPGAPHDNDGVSASRNPDNFFPTRQGTPPDRLGVLFIRVLEFLADGWEAARGRKPRLARGFRSLTDPASDSSPL